VLLFFVVDSDEIDKQLTKNLLERDNREELRVDQDVCVIALSSDGVLDLRHEVRLRLVHVRNVIGIMHEKLHVLEDALPNVLVDVFVLVLELLVDHRLQLVVREEDRAILGVELEGLFLRLCVFSECGAAIGVLFIMLLLGRHFLFHDGVLELNIFVSPQELVHRRREGQLVLLLFAEFNIQGVRHDI